MAGPHEDDRARSAAAQAPTIDVGSGEPREANASTQDGAHDSFEDLLRRVVQGGAPVLPVAELEVGSELVGRFLITRVLGRGGMGTVYMARDATLGREVAIKVHHAAGGAHRLRREAVAMARLAHPNVVTVFEVGDLAGRPFVVMEYVTGQTLRSWLAEAPRAVGDILEVVIAAGDGLAAAHDAGLVHRDVKPENVLIGVDGRPRVGDFGLARELDARDEAITVPSGPADSLMTPMTQTGAVMGTPAYMAPEQLSGAPVDARADQFAYCVTAWEALWKQRPFAGATFDQLKTAILRGERRAPPAVPKVPARVRRALERGLAVDPAARFPSLHALLDAMAPAIRRRRRWLVAAGAAGIAALALAAVAMLWGPAGPSCDAAGTAELAGLRMDLPLRLREHGAAKIATQAEAVQWGYVARFRGDATRACEAARAHEWSPEVAAQSHACFTITGRTAQLLVAGADPARPMDALRRLRRLPPDDQCVNQNHLASQPPIPHDPQQLEALTAAKATLAAGFDGGENHDFAALKRAIAELEASPAHTDPGIAAGLIALHGWSAYADGHVAETRKLFVDAYYAGRAIDDEQISSTALILLIADAEELGFDLATIKEWLRTALADADRIRARSPWLAGRVYATAASAAELARDAPGTLLFIARARAVLAPGTRAWIATFSIEGSAKIWSGQIDDGIKAYDAAIAQDIADLGPDDPDVATLYSDYAASLLDVERLDDALDKAEHAMAIIRVTADPSDDRIDGVRVNLAAVLISADKKEAEALDMLRTARANDVRRLGENNTVVANIDSDLATIYIGHGEYDKGITALDSSLAIQEKLLGHDHVGVAAVLFNLAAAYRFKHDYPAAIAAALRAADIFRARMPGSDRLRTALTMAANAANDAGDPVRALDWSTQALAFAKPAETIQTTAWSQIERARALIGLHRGAEARPLLIAARAGYAGLVMPQRVQQCDDLLAKLH